MRAMICNFPSVFANEYKRIKPEKCAVEYSPRAFRAFSRPFFSPTSKARLRFRVIQEV